MSGPLLILIGPPGAGKSTVGALVAGRLGVAFHDSDALIETADQRAISDIFVDSGEPYFRDLERRTIATALTDLDGVLALGGGAVLDPSTRALLADRPVAFLRLGLTEAARRVGLGTSRPLLLGNVRATMKTMLDQRTPLYEEVARWTVDTDEVSADQVADEVAGLVVS